MRDAEALVLAAERHREVGADVEQLVLHAFEHGADLVRKLSARTTPRCELSPSTAPYATIRGSSSTRASRRRAMFRRGLRPA